MLLLFKKLWQKIRNPLNNLWAFIVLILGIAIMVAGVGFAFWMKFSLILSIIISAIGGLIGGIIIDGALRRFDFKNGENDKLEKELEEEQKKNRELSEALKKAETDKIDLQRRLDTSTNITRIQPVMKLIVGEISFDTVNYYEKPLDEEKTKTGLTGLITRKVKKSREYYRGVYKYSGQAELRVDFAKIKVAETDDTITICGPLEYEQKVIPNLKECEWRMHGRHEREEYQGTSDKDMELAAITVTKTQDQTLEKEQMDLLQDDILKITDSMKTSGDRLVFEIVKLLLAPTGKQITYDPTASAAIPTRTLGELVADHNRRAALPGSQNAVNGYLENL